MGTLDSDRAAKSGENDLGDKALFTPKFFLLSFFSFVTFYTAFQLYPTMPFRILALQGSEGQAGLFLGLLTFASAWSAPFGGAITDRLGQRHILMTSSTVFFLCSFIFFYARSLWIILPLAVVFGVFWSALLAASFALMTDIIPAERRAEGIGYWGVAGIFAIVVSPLSGLEIYNAYGWHWLCGGVAFLSLVLLTIAFILKDKPHAHPSGRTLRGFFSEGFFERRVFVISISLFLYSFGYGGVTSFVALYARDSGTHPIGLFFLVFAGTMVLARPATGRVADRLGRRRIFLPSLALIGMALILLSISGSFWNLVASAVIYGLGFGSAYPVFAAMVLDRIDSHRHGAAYGSILLAFDTGIGSGSILTGIFIQHFGYHMAFGVTAGVAMFAIPYYLMAERKLQGQW
ncbi:MAG: MFS transporter [Acidobacteriia bacterium]|nr:MFS transporter [Terriglobia bacterium]